MRAKCPHCGHSLVEPAGPPTSPILLLGEFPGMEEIKVGRPWVGKAGEILRDELARVGISMASCRATNLWLHAPSKECPYDWHLDQAMKELQGRKAVLLIGSEVTRVFLDAKVSDWVGLQVKSKLLPKTVKVAVVSYNPAIALHGSIGEIRFAFQRFAKLTEGLR